MRSRVLLICLALMFATTANAVNVGLDPSANWLGFMNVSDLPANGGAYEFGMAWGVPDLTATFSGAVLSTQEHLQSVQCLI